VLAVTVEAAHVAGTRGLFTNQARPQPSNALAADSDDAATQIRYEAAGDSDLIPPVLGRSVGGLSLVVLVAAGQACLGDLPRVWTAPHR
jgi:hypothetical protein